LRQPLIHIGKYHEEKKYGYILIWSNFRFFCGCSSQQVKFNINTVSPTDKVGVLVTYGDCHVSTGNFSLGLVSLITNDIVDRASGQKAKLRKKLSLVQEESNKIIIENLSNNWPNSLPPNPKVINMSEIVRNKKMLI